jgi:hypothetical protein
MHAFLDWLPAPEPVTAPSYRLFVLEHPGMPWHYAFERHGGWGAIRDEVLAERAAHGGSATVDGVQASRPDDV